MKKTFYFTAFLVLFLLNNNLIFSQQCTDLGTSMGFNAQQDLTQNMGIHKIEIVPNVDNVPYLIGFQRNSNSSISNIIHRYNFSGNLNDNPIKVMLGDTYLYNLSIAIPSSARVGLNDVEAYGDTGIVCFAGKCGFFIIDNAGNSIGGVVNTTPNEFEFFDIACDPENNAIYVSTIKTLNLNSSSNNSTINIWRYNIDLFNTSNVIDASQFFNITIGNNLYAHNTILENIPGTDFLAYSYNSHSNLETNPRASRLGLINKTNFVSGSIFGIDFSASVLLFETPQANAIKCLEFDTVTNSLYVGGDYKFATSAANQFNGFKSYNIVGTGNTGSLELNSGFTPHLATITVINALDFYCDSNNTSFVIAGGAINQGTLGGGGSSLKCFATNDGANVSLPGYNATVDFAKSTLRDVEVYTTNTSVSVFCGGDQTISENETRLTRHCLGFSALSFDYCKTNNSDGTYNIQITSEPHVNNVAFLLNGVLITDLVNDLMNLSGSNTISVTANQFCIPVCYEETITNGGNCNSINGKPTQPKRSTSNSTKKNSSPEEVKGKLVTISPNPSEGVFTIKGDFNPNQNVEIDVYDLMAKSIVKKTISNFNINGEELDLKNQSAGTYIISITQGATKITHTIIKE